MVRTVMIIEVAGNPSIHVKESLEKHVGVLGKMKDVTVHSNLVSEPKEIENSNGIFTCFAEVDFEVENLSKVTEIVFDFMPSSIEITEPSKIILDSSQATSLLNNISGRMHKYDEIAAIAQGKMRNMVKENNFLKQLLIDNKIFEVYDGKIRMKKELLEDKKEEQVKQESEDKSNNKKENKTKKKKK